MAVRGWVRERSRRRQRGAAWIRGHGNIRARVGTAQRLSAPLAASGLPVTPCLASVTMS